MSAYSTMKITRKDAMKVIINSLMDASDEKIEEILFELKRDRLYNYKIVSQYETENPEDENWCHEYHAGRLD